MISSVEKVLVVAGDVGFEHIPRNHGQRILHSHSAFSNAQNFQIIGGIIIVGSVSLSALRDVFGGMNIPEGM